MARFLFDYGEDVVGNVGKLLIRRRDRGAHVVALQMLATTEFRDAHFLRGTNKSVSLCVCINAIPMQIFLHGIVSENAVMPWYESLGNSERLKMQYPPRHAMANMYPPV